MDGDGGSRARTVREALPDVVGRGGVDLLVTGRSAELLRGLFRGLIDPVDSDDHGVVVASTRVPPELITAHYGLGAVGDAEGRLAVVDCTPGGTGVDVGTDRLRWTVPAPTDFRESSLALGECLDALASNGVERRHLVYDSLTTVLRSADVDDVLQFVHGISAPNHGREGVGLFPVYVPSTDREDLDRLKTVFDGLVAVRAEGSATSIRVRGFRDAPDGWIPVEEEPDPSPR